MSRAKYDILLDQKPLQLTNYMRQSSDDLVARFGSSEKGETNLDMLKAETQKSYGGGMFQRLMEDPEKVSSISGAYFNEDDKKLYFAADPDKKQSPSAYGDQVTASMVGDGKVWFGVRSSIYIAGIPDENKLFVWYASDGNVYQVTLPDAIRLSQSPITSMVWHGNRGFLCGQVNKGGADVGFSIYRLENTTGNGTSTTFHILHSLASPRRFMVSFRSKLYCIGAYDFDVVTNEFGTAGTGAYSDVKNAGVYYNWTDVVHFMRVFNGAVWIGKIDGLFRFDGVDIVNVVDTSSSQLTSNFSSGDVWNGRLYYSMDKKVYRFDGTNIEMVADFTSELTSLVGISGCGDRLVVSGIRKGYTVSNPKFGDTTTSTYVWFAYTGFGFYEVYSAVSIFADYNFPVYAVGGWGRIFYLYGTGYYNGSLEPRYTAFKIDSFDPKNEFTANYRQNTMTIISSEINNGYPSVDKMLSGVSIDAQAVQRLDEFSIYVRTEPDSFTDDEEWGDWTLVYQAKAGFFPTEGLSHNLHDGFDGSIFFIPSQAIRYKRLQYKIYATQNDWTGITDVFRLRSTTLRYSIAPRQRLRWTLSANLTSYIEDLRAVEFGDGTADTRSASEIRAMVYHSMRSKAPVLMYDVEHFTVTAMAGNSVTFADVPHELNVGDVLAFTSDDTNWVNRRVSSISGSTVWLDPTRVRVALGGADIPLVNGMRARISRMVYVSRIITDQYDISDVGTTDNELDGTDSKIVLELREL